MTARQHDEADRQLVVAALHPGRNADPDYYSRQADAVLDALVDSGRWIRADPDEPHLIEFRADGWTIQHPLRCRPNLFACEVNRVGEQIPGPPRRGVGTYECWLDGEGALVVGPPAGGPGGGR